MLWVFEKYLPLKIKEIPTCLTLNYKQQKERASFYYDLNWLSPV